MLEGQLYDLLNRQGLRISKKDLKYLSPDYNTNMYFYSSSFKGDYIEKSYMHRLLNKVPVIFENERESKRGFLDHLIGLPEGATVKARLSYTRKDIIPKEKKFSTEINGESDLSKAISLR